MLRTFQVSKFLKEKKISKKSPDDFTREIVKLFLKSLISKREQLTSTHLEFAYFMSKNEVPLLGGNIYSSMYIPFLNTPLSALSNLWWMPDSGSIGFRTATRTGWSRKYQRPSVKCQLQFGFTVDIGLSSFILTNYKGKLTWNSPMEPWHVFRIVLMSPFFGTVTKTFADWVGHSF